MGLRTWLGLKKPKPRKSKKRQAALPSVRTMASSTQGPASDLAQVGARIVNRHITNDELCDTVGRDARIILDIGANNGWHTNLFLRLFPRATIYAFEPDPRAIKKFKARVNDPRVRLLEIAIGAEDGSVEFHQSGGFPPHRQSGDYQQGWDMSGSLRSPKEVLRLFPWCKFESTIIVPVRRLDTWARENGIGAVDFIWADVQGAERDLIAGGAETLARTRLFYTEYYDNELYEGQWTLAQIVDALPSFNVVARYPADVMLRNIAFGAR